MNKRVRPKLKRFSAAKQRRLGKLLDYRPNSRALWGVPP